MHENKYVWEGMEIYTRRPLKWWEKSKNRIRVYIAVGLAILALIWLYNWYEVWMLTLIPTQFKWVAMH